jgi:hypothetical protein
MAVSESELAEARTLLRMLTAERRRGQLEQILSRLANLADIPDCGPLLPLTRHRWWQVRHEAIRVLGKCRDQRAEEALLAVLANPLDDHDLVYATASLGECGSAEASHRGPGRADPSASRGRQMPAVYALAKLVTRPRCRCSSMRSTTGRRRSSGTPWPAIQQHGDERRLGDRAVRSHHGKRPQRDSETWRQPRFAVSRPAFAAVMTA